MMGILLLDPVAFSNMLLNIFTMERYYCWVEREQLISLYISAENFGPLIQCFIVFLIRMFAANICTIKH